MPTVLPLATPRFLTDEQGNTLYAVLPIEEYNHLINIAKYYQQDDDNLTAEDLRKIVAAREQAKQGLGISSEEVHKKVKELKYGTYLDA
jgi:hypothetical protein